VMASFFVSRVRVVIVILSEVIRRGTFSGTEPAAAVCSVRAVRAEPGEADAAPLEVLVLLGFPARLAHLLACCRHRNIS
jgi:hypothetical protein